MGSDATSTTKNETNNLALDASVTNGEGVSILDSIIVDPSDKVMVETIQQHKAAFEIMMAESSFQLEELLGLGSNVLALADNQSVRLEGFAYKQLESGVEFLRQAKESGKYVIDLAQDVSGRSFDLAENSVAGGQDIAIAALELVADVKTESSQKTLTKVIGVIALFGLGAIYLTNKD